MNALPPLTPVGRVGRRHGTRGELTLQLTRSIEDETGDVPDCLFITIEGLPVPFFIDEWRGKGDTNLIVKFDDVDTEAQAAELVGCELSLPTDELEGREAEMLTWQAFKGYRVETAEGEPIGHITAVDDRNANILLYVMKADGNEVLLPLHEDFIHELDHDTRLLRLELPQGLLDING